jgi:tetratricopeptide (TPR) repeat protein
MDEAEGSFTLFTPREQVAALLNRGLAHLSLLHLEPARADLDRALELSVEEAMPEQEFKARHNLGCLEFYAGRFPQAIRLMRAADEVDAPVQRARARRDLALVLLEVGLLDQARTTLRSALAEARTERLRLDEGDIHLDLARCAALAGQREEARANLGAAVAAYRSRGATQRQHAAALQRATAALEERRVPRGLAALLEPWAQVTHPTTPDERLATRVRAQAALVRGDLVTAADAVTALGSSSPQGVEAEMHDWLLRARLAAAQGDLGRARRTVRRGLTRLTARQQPTQSLEVRAALALHGRPLAAFDLGDALRSGSVRRVFDSVERWRAVSHRLPPVAADLDPEGTALLARLRQIRRAIATDDLAEQASRERLRADAAQLEWQVAERDWGSTDRASSPQGAHALSLSRIKAVLGERGEAAMVFFEHDGEQFCLELGGNRTRLRRLGRRAVVAALAERLHRDQGAQAFASTNPALDQVLERAVESSRRELDHALFGDSVLSAAPGMVVVPGRTLSAVPWSSMPSLTGRPVTVSPSMTRWALGHQAPRTGNPRSVAALAGPGLARAATEVVAVAAAWQGHGSAACSGQATSADVRQALASAAVVHVAAHGRHEEQSPFFSSLRMSDGPVFAHELPRPLVAEHVVLSACEVGRSDLRPGDEPLGLTAALLALGARSVVGAVAPVLDAVAADAMASYHRHLAAGQSAASALAMVVEEEPRAGAFCLYGTDWSPAS